MINLITAVLMKAYYQDSHVALYHGDAGDLIASLPCASLITDPVWPGCEHILPGIDADAVFAAVLRDADATRLAIHIGCDSDPRFLAGVPLRWPFFRTATLDLARPGYKGRLLMTGDTAYLFGPPPTSRPGAHMIPGCTVDSRGRGRESDHPCPRKLNQAGWLVRCWSNPSDTILDPFAGSGTILVTAKNLGRKAFGIEIEESYCEMAANRLRQSVFEFEEREAQPA